VYLYRKGTDDNFSGCHFCGNCKEKKLDFITSGGYSDTLNN
jgi:hypothetical protein